MIGGRSREIELSSAPSPFVIYVSAENEYLLKVNGKYVETGPLQRYSALATYDHDIAPAP